MMQKRKTYYIDKGFQNKFILRFCAIQVAASALIGLLIYYFNRQSSTVAFENLRVVVKSTADFILPIMLQVVLVVSALVAVATVFFILFTSHKIAGPLYRIGVELERIKSGDLSKPVQIRSSDQLRKVADEVEALRKNSSRSIADLNKAWSALKDDALSGGGAKKKEVEENIQRIDQLLSQYKI